MSKTSTAKQLREKHGVKASESVSARVKEYSKTSSQVVKLASAGPKTIPEMARELGIEVSAAAWLVLTMTRHKKLQAVQKNEDGYWLYAPAAEEGD